jgi:hypothetical protein
MSNKPKSPSAPKDPAVDPKDQNERFAFTVNWTSRGMTFPPGKVFTRAFLESRKVDIDLHLEKKLLEKVSEKEK